MDRRKFLTTAGAATVYKLTGAAPQLKAAGPNSQVSLGFIGSGIRGTQLINEMTSEAAKMLAVCDLYDGCLARAKEQIRPDILTTKDYRTVLDRKDIDAVVIATPDHLHRRIVLDALAAGKHVYCEKPLTWSLEEGKEIMAAEKASGKVLMVGSQAKTSALTARMRELIAGGAIGKVHMVRMINHRASAEGAWKYPVPPDASPETIDWKRFLGHYPNKPFDARTFFQWRCWWEYSGGVATDLFVHLLTWLHEVMNVTAPVAVSSHGGIFKWDDGRTVPDYMNSLFDYAEGFIFDVYVNLATSFRQRTSMIYGIDGSMWEERGSVVVWKEPVDLGVQPYGNFQWPKAMREQYFVSKGWSAEGQPPQLPAPVEPETIAVERGLPHAQLFLKSIRDGEPSRENAAEGHYAAGAAHVANISYRRKKRASWDWKSGKVTV
jgi:predicted dehydrogenase